MDYAMEELVPVVGRLVQKYTANESISITYEKAEQLMEAVLYCIHELEEEDSNTPVLNALAPNEKLPAQQAYEMGLACVEEKTKRALRLYNEMMPEFCYYGKRCLHDTVVKGIPEFFQWYDMRFDPQNTILTLDYPVRKDLSGYTGIDRIYAYLRCIRLEQKFLRIFPAGYVTEALSQNDRYWKDSLDNICETVLIHAAREILEGKDMTEKELRLAVKNLVEEYYENEKELLFYLSGIMKDVIVRLKIAAENPGGGHIV